MFGYRTNLLIADGDGYVSGSQLRRQLAAVALDVHPFAHTTIEGNFSYYNLYPVRVPRLVYLHADITPIRVKSPYTIMPSNAPDPTAKVMGRDLRVWIWTIRSAKSG